VESKRVCSGVVLSFLDIIGLILTVLFVCSILATVIGLFVDRQLSKPVELFPNNRPFHEGKLTQRHHLTLFKYANSNTYGTAIFKRNFEGYPFSEKRESMNVGHYTYQLGLF
jgi:hypothetical protein